MFKALLLCVVFSVAWFFSANATEFCGQRRPEIVATVSTPAKFKPLLGSFSGDWDVNNKCFSVDVRGVQETGGDNLSITVVLAWGGNRAGVSEEFNIAGRVKEGDPYMVEFEPLSYGSCDSRKYKISFTESAPDGPAWVGHSCTFRGEVYKVVMKRER